MAARSILFDLDGTVVDSKPGILASSRAALAALGHPVDTLDIDHLIGPPLEEVLAEVLRPLGDDRVAEAALAYRDHYGRTGFRETTVYPGLTAVLDQLIARGARLYIATSKRTHFAERILRRLGLFDRFAGVHGSEPDGAMDAKADVIAHVLRTHHLTADRSLMVGDRRQDIEGARAHGVATVGVLWGYGDRAELESAGAKHIASEPADLIPIVEVHGNKVRA